MAKKLKPQWGRRVNWLPRRLGFHRALHSGGRSGGGGCRSSAPRAEFMEWTDLLAYIIGTEDQELL